MSNYRPITDIWILARAKLKGGEKYLIAILVCSLMIGIMPKLYSKQELRFIQGLAREKVNDSRIAKLCNDRFHSGSPMRTAKAIGYAVVDKLKIGTKRFTRNCDVCSGVFATSWPNARYCGEECRAVVDRQYAGRIYRLNPAQNIQQQTKRVRARVLERWKIILDTKGDSCSRCKEKFPFVVYDLHHPRGKESRKDTPSRVIRGGTQEDFHKMLSSVIILCANCHRLTHFELNNWSPRNV